MGSIIYNLRNTVLDKIVHSITDFRQQLKMRKLRSFLEDADIIPYIQPIFDSDGKTIKGCEILMRVEYDGKTITPSIFITDLEDSDMLDSVTASLFKKVHDIFHPYKRHLPKGFYFSFNITSPQLDSEEIVESAISFNKSFQNYASLTLEIVERRTEYIDDAIDAMDNMISTGINFALDDFGSDNTSFKHIENEGFSILKIDKSLTLSNNGMLIYKNIIESIIQLSHSLGLSVTAEGVENAEQIKLLKKAGVDSLQGFYLSRPISALKFVDSFLLTNRS